MARHAPHLACLNPRTPGTRLQRRAAASAGAALVLPAFEPNSGRGKAALARGRKMAAALVAGRV